MVRPTFTPAAFRRTTAAAVAIITVALFTTIGRAAPPTTYTLAGVDCQVAATNATFWCFNDAGFSGLTAYRNAVADPARFGPAGTVPVTVTTVARSSFTAADSRR